MQDLTERVLADGLDFKSAENKAALIDYLKRCLNIPLLYEPAARQDGSLIIELADVDERSVFEAAKWLTVVAPRHLILGQEVKFSPFYQPRNTRTVGRTKDRGFSRGRGLGKQPRSDTLLSGYGHGSTIPQHGGPLKRQQVFEYASSHDGRRTLLSSRQSKDEEGFANSGPFSVPAQVPGSLPTFSPTPTSCPRPLDVPLTAQKMGQPTEAEMAGNAEKQLRSTELLSVPITEAGFMRKGPTEGTDVITIRDLPLYASPGKVLDEVKKAIILAKSNISFEAHFVSWAIGEARVHINNMEAVSAWWRLRHRCPLKYDGYLLSWDVTVPDRYEENRILVEGLPDGMTPYNLMLHIKSTDCVPEDVEITPVFLSDSSKAIVFFSDITVDNTLIEELRREGSEYEIDDSSPIMLSFHLVPRSRTMQLSDLDRSVDKQTILNYFKRLDSKIYSTVPILVEEVRIRGDDLSEDQALVTLRTSEGVRSVMSISRLPELGPRRPQLRVYELHPFSPTAVNNPIGNDVDLVSPLQETLTSQRGSRNEVKPSAFNDVATVAIEVDDPVLIDYIWNIPKQKCRLERDVGCGSLRWDGLLITSDHCSRSIDECKKIVDKFVSKFEQKKLQLPDARLWKQGTKLIGEHLRTRDSEMEVFPLADKSGFIFIGQREEVRSCHKHFTGIVAQLHAKLAEETATVLDSVLIPSAQHGLLLELVEKDRALVEVRLPENERQHYLEVCASKSRVEEAKEYFPKIIQEMESVEIELDRQVVVFLKRIGLEEINMLFRNYGVDALAFDLDTGLRVLAVGKFRDQARRVVEANYACVPVVGTEENEIQDLLRSVEYRQFVTRLCDTHVVEVVPNCESIERTLTKFSLVVVGKSSPARQVSRSLTSFLLDNAVFKIELKREHSAYARYLFKYKRQELEVDRIRTRFQAFKADVQENKTSGSITVLATRKGLQSVREKVDELYCSVLCDEVTLEGHGIKKYIRGEQFKLDRSRVEKMSETIICINDEVDLDEELNVGTLNNGSSIESAEQVVPRYSHSQRSPSTGVASRYQGKDGYSVSLPHGVLLSVNEGDVIGDDSDVIVALMGEEFNLVCDKSPLSKSELTARFGGAPNPVADVGVSGQLGCKCVYAVSLSPCSQAAKSEQCVRVIQSRVELCLKMAQSAGYSSISFPAIGTGRLGYGIDVAAAGILGASKAFAGDCSVPKLRRIRVCTADPRRPSDFERELKKLFEGSSPSGFRKVAASFSGAFGSLFSRGETSKHVGRRPAVKAFGTFTDDEIVASILVFGYDRAKCKMAHSLLRNAVATNYVRDQVVTIPEGFDFSRIQRLTSSCSVGLSMKSFKSSAIGLSGFREDVSKVHSTLLQWFSEQRPEAVATKGVAVPEWFHFGADSCSADVRQQLLPDDDEFRKVRKAFVETNGKGTIVAIEKIENPKLYRRYRLEKQHIANTRQREIEAGQARLDIEGFHGTNSTAIQEIISNGFNRVHAGSARGTRFGTGVYFASTAGLASTYATPDDIGEKRLLFCDVLVGLYTKGDTSMKEPPVINPSINPTDRYDSTVNDTLNPSIFVSCYRDNMAYPRYLITFK